MFENNVRPQPTAGIRAISILSLSVAALDGEHKHLVVGQSSH
jgi:hypothetical protein